MRHRTLLTFLFGYRDWTKPVLLLSLLFMVPLLGPVVVHGWGVRLMHRRLRGDLETLPEVDDPVALFKEGLMPFIGSIITNMGLAMFVYPILIILYVGAAIQCGVAFLFTLPFGAVLEPLSMSFVVHTGVAVMCLFALTIMSVNVLAALLLLRIEITGQLEAMVAFRELKTEIRSMYWDVLSGTLMLAVFAVPLVLMGYLACFVGVFPVIFILTIGMMEVRIRAYRRYLERGGTPIAEISHVDGGSLLPPSVGS